MDLVKPQRVVNGYLWSELKKLDNTLAAKYGSTIPIYPLSDAESGQKQWDNKPYFIYNRAFRVQHGFYVTKRDTFIYSLRAGAADMIEWQQAVQQILDRQDDAAHDINMWNLKNTKEKVWFHTLRVHQNEPPEARDYTTKPYYTSNFMVNLEYHLL